MSLRTRVAPEKRFPDRLSLNIIRERLREVVMMGKRIDITGNKYGSLEVLRFSHKDKWRASHWKCKCDCGEETVVSGSNLKRNHTQSCGCLHGERHGKAYTPEYRSWSHMITRCTNPNHIQYEDWGGRGIKVCDRWKNSFSAFLEDMGDKPSLKHSIERIDNDKNYEPSNCEWVDKSQQAINRRLFKSNTSGFKGVNWNKRMGKWKATITFQKKVIHLGFFEGKEDAVRARFKAEQKYFKSS